LSVTLFEKSPVLEVLAPSNYKNKIASGQIQLNLFDF